MHLYHLILIILLILYMLIIIHLVYIENFNGVYNWQTPICSQCDNRIVTGTVYASRDPNVGYSGLGWIL